MAKRKIYLTVRLTIENSEVDSITDEAILELIGDIDYEFKNYDSYTIESELYEYND